MATAGTIVFKVETAAEIVLAEGGKYYVDAATAKLVDTTSYWTKGPLGTEAKYPSASRGGCRCQLWGPRRRGRCYQQSPEMRADDEVQDRAA
jgi:hypothetical protein